MATINPIDILLAHDKWATLQILAACEPLSPEQFDRKFEMGPGSLRATLTHFIGAMGLWSDILAVRTPRTRIDLDGKTYSLPELTAIHIATADEFAKLAHQYPLEGEVKRIRDGKEYTFTRAAVLTHVPTHGMHHRAQCLNMLRHVGVKQPPSSIIEWSRLVDAK